MHHPTPPKKQDATKAKRRNKPGPKPSKDVSQIQKRLACSRRRAQQLAKEAAEATGQTEVLLNLKIQRQRQICEKGEIELQRLRSGEEETIPVSKMKEGIRCFLRAASVALDMQSQRLAIQIGADWQKFGKEFHALASGGYYSALGTLLYLGDNKIVQSVREVLEEGDTCFPKGPGAEETARHNALVSASWTLANHAEGQAGTPEQLKAVKAMVASLGLSSSEEAQ